MKGLKKRGMWQGKSGMDKDDDGKDIMHKQTYIYLTKKGKERELDRQRMRVRSSQIDRKRAKERK